MYFQISIIITIFFRKITMLRKSNIISSRPASHFTERINLNYLSKGQVLQCTRRQPPKRIYTEQTSLILNYDPQICHNDINIPQQLIRNKSDFVDKENTNKPIGQNGQNGHSGAICISQSHLNKSKQVQLSQKVQLLSDKITRMELKITEFEKKEQKIVLNTEIKRMIGDICQQKYGNGKIKQSEQFQRQLISLREQLKSYINKKQFEQLVSSIKQIKLREQKIQNEINKYNISLKHFQQKFIKTEGQVKDQFDFLFSQIESFKTKPKSNSVNLSQKSLRQSSCSLNNQKQKIDVQTKHMRASSSKKNYDDFTNQILDQIHYSKGYNQGNHLGKENIFIDKLDIENEKKLEEKKQRSSYQQTFNGMYFIDRDGFLLDINSYYILNTQGNPIRLDKNDERFLKNNGMMS